MTAPVDPLLRAHLHVSTLVFVRRKTNLKNHFLPFVRIVAIGCIVIKRSASEKLRVISNLLLHLKL